MATPHDKRHAKRRADREKSDLIAGVLIVIFLITSLVLVRTTPWITDKLGRLSKRPVEPKVSQGFRDYVKVTSNAVWIINNSKQHWAEPAVVVNGEYLARCPDMPMRTGFEIEFKQLQGPRGSFEKATQPVQTVKITPANIPAIIWEQALH